MRPGRLRRAACPGRAAHAPHACGDPASDARAGAERAIARALRLPSGVLAHGTSSYDHRTVMRMQTVGGHAVLDPDGATEDEGDRVRVTRAEGMEDRIRAPDEVAPMARHASARTGRPIPVAAE